MRRDAAQLGVSQGSSVTCRAGRIWQSPTIWIGLCLLAWAPGCTRFTVLNATVPHWGYCRTTDIAYGPLPRQKLDVYRPAHSKSVAGVVIFFYGGDWQTGSKEDYFFVAQALTERGFVAVMPNYGLYPQVVFPTFVEDGAAAVRWTHDNAARFGADPQRIFLMGHSAGAHIAALLTLDEHYLRAVGLDRTDIRATAGLSGPYDFTPPGDDLAAFGMAPGSPPNPAIEPVNFVDGREPPMLLVQGLKDTTVGEENARHLAERIREKGGEVKTIHYPNRAHVGVVLSLAWSFRWLAPTLDDVAKFFELHGTRALKSE